MVEMARMTVGRTAFPTGSLPNMDAIFVDSSGKCVWCRSCSLS